VADARFRALVLDLFDTLVRWDAERIPQLEWRGRLIRSTAPLVFPVLEEALGARFDRDAYLEAHDAVYREIFAERAGDEDAVEVTCLERFTRTLERMGLRDGATAALALRLRTIHMGWVRRITAAPPERAAAVRALGPHYRLGLLSNFDDAETGHLIVQDTGVREHFDVVMISAEVGLRKPNPRIFERMAAALLLEPREILFVGDTVRDDVLGAKRAGMCAAWINRDRLPLPEGVPAPDLEIADLADLPAALGV
jgi:FMN phosphatase YigB (HAD superfamily)